MKPSLRRVLLAFIVLIAAAALDDGGGALPQDIECEFSKQALEEAVDFKFVEGYYPPIQGMSKDSLKELHMNLSTYRCKPDTLNYQYLTPDERAFDSRKFLSQLQGRTLSMIGDSLGIQTFNGLDSEIHPLLGSRKRDNDPWLDIIGGEQVSWQRNGPRVKAARRDSLDEWNSTIYFCNDPTLETLMDLSNSDKDSGNRDQVTYCSRIAVEQAIRSGGVLLLTVGPWYKPNYDKSKSGDGSSATSSLPDTSSFTAEHFQKHLNEFKKSVYRVRRSVDMYRQKLHEQGLVSAERQVQVIWRLVSSCGHLTELDRAYSGIPNGHGFNHKDGYLWQALTEQMPPGDIPGFSWAAQYNAVLSAVARRHQDYLLNSWVLSHHMIKFSIHPHMHQWRTKDEMDAQRKIEAGTADPDRVQIHADSLHSCAGGIQRAEVLLLSELIAHKLRCPGM